jgi:hypothetical protein
MSHTMDTTITDYIWDVAARLPVVHQDGTDAWNCAKSVGFVS